MRVWQGEGSSGVSRDVGVSGALGWQGIGCQHTSRGSRGHQGLAGGEGGSGEIRGCRGFKRHWGGRGEGIRGWQGLGGVRGPLVLVGGVGLRGPAGCRSIRGCWGPARVLGALGMAV